MLFSAGGDSLCFVTWIGPSEGRHHQGDDLGKQCLRPHSWFGSLPRSKKNYTVTVMKKIYPLEIASMRALKGSPRRGGGCLGFCPGYRGAGGCVC